MIAKTIQNFENKREIQITRLETRIKKVQEMFNKDLEELKNSQSTINNTIIEIRAQTTTQLHSSHTLVK